MCRGDNKISVRAVYAESVGTKGTKMFATSDKDNIFPRVCQSATEISSHAASSKHGNPHLILLSKISL
jgi:hypothetical protein